MLPGCGNTPTGLTGPGDGTLGGTVLDSDGDGFSDDEEINFIPGTDPFDATDNPNNVRDTDGDGCSDFDELNFIGFCDGNPFTSPCPFELDEGQGFAVTIPCGFAEVENSLVPILGATYQRLYQSTDLVIAVVVFPSSGPEGSLPEEFITFQLNGPVITSTGDFLLSVNAEGSGFEGEKAIGMLANGDFLKVLVMGTRFDQDIQLVAGGIFLSIDLQDTDGSGYINFLTDFANVLQVGPSDSYIVLEDDSVWFVGTDDDAVVAFWNDADLVLRGTPDSSFDDAMFTSMVSWESVDARLCGTGTQGTVGAINEPDFGAREIVLESGAVLKSSFADEDKLLFWQVGDPVSVVTGASCSTWSTYVVNLRTGSAVGVP
jgi:hypothetical protein